MSLCDRTEEAEKIFAVVVFFSEAADPAERGPGADV